METSAAQALNGTPSQETRVGLVAGRVIDASLFAMLLSAPLLATGGGGETFAILSIIAVGGVTTLYQRGSRAKRLTRCTWLLFFAIAMATFLAAKALAPVSIANAAGRWAALCVKWALVTGLATWGIKLVLERRGPRLKDAFDWGAALTIAILLVSAATFAVSGDALAVGALAMPCAFLGMHFVVREQCQSLDKARRFAQIAMGSAIVALAGWAFT